MAAGAIGCGSIGDSGTVLDGLFIYIPSLTCLPRRSLVRRRAHHRYEQVGDARRAHVAQCGELLAIDIVEQ
jgi:hypothetical protein